MLEIKNNHQEWSCSGRVYGVIDGKEVSTIQYNGNPKKCSVIINTIYTDKEHRGNGYASQLLKYFIEKYGDKMDILLSCSPYEHNLIEDKNIRQKYKEEQEKLAKWYRGFGFITMHKNEYQTTYDWVMIRNK